MPAPTPAKLEIRAHLGFLDGLILEKLGQSNAPIKPLFAALFKPHRTAQQATTDGTTKKAQDAVHLGLLEQRHQPLRMNLTPS